MGKDEVLTQARAWGVYDQWCNDPRVLFLEEPASIERVFRSITTQSRPAARDWADSYLLAFASAADLRLVTLDKGLRLRDSAILLLE